jgi:hypothetical protein
MKCAVIMLVLAVCATAQEPKKEVAAIAALEPAALVTGGAATMKIRGFKLKDATEIRFPKAPGVKAVVKEKKDAGQVNVLDNKATGDTQIVAEFTLPADLPAGPLEFTIATPAGDAAAKIPVVAASAAVEEKEPNNGFRETQKLALGQSIVGSINGERDVDVYEITAKAGQKIRATVTGGSALTMDAALACYDARGQFLASCDDAETRDPVLSLTAPADGPLLLCISDAHDKGGEWHSYLLTVEEAK